MTLIAIHTGPDAAHVLTDGLSYTDDGSLVDPIEGPCKARPLGGLPAVVAYQGVSNEFWATVHTAMGQAAAEAADFDQFTGWAARLLPDMRRVLGRYVDDGAEVADGVMFTVGFSPAAGRFVARGYGSAVDFEPVELDDMYVMPAPMATRVGPFECAQVAKMLTGSAEDDDALYRWATRPPLPAPATVAQWVQLATYVRADRALPDTPLKVFVGGSVHLTTITRDGVSVEQVHSFDDPDEFRQMVAGTAHPLAQPAAMAAA